ncbi:hypothetical protein GCM10027057_16920 [Marisediminicola antarctica]
MRAQKKPVDDRLENWRDYDAFHQNRRRGGRLMCDTPMDGIRHEKLHGLVVKKNPRSMAEDLGAVRARKLTLTNLWMV